MNEDEDYKPPRRSQVSMYGALDRSRPNPDARRTTLSAAEEIRMMEEAKNQARSEDRA